MRSSNPQPLLFIARNADDSTELQTIGGIVSGKSDQGILQFSKDYLLSNC
mgnify:FL=1